MALDNADFKSMTRDQLAVHLVLRDADASMAKIATEFLQLDPNDQSMADFRTKLRQTEHRNMVLDTKDQEPIRLDKGGVQFAA